MSRNFELLRRLGKSPELGGPVPADAGSKQPAAPSGIPRQLDQPSLEEISVLAQQVFLAPGADAPRTVVLTGTEPGTGCTWVCAHLGEALAGRVAGSVCLLDANLRDPGLHSQFGMDNQAGLADALVQSNPIQSLARPLTPPNLWLISSGSAIDSAQNLLTADRMRLRLAELRAAFDFILIDVSPMGVSNDAISLGSIADGVVLVLQANASRRQAARQAIQELQAGKTKVLGAVLNRRTFPIPDSIYKRF
jgi:Mrp family chromosome partitioning ATPase